MKNTKRASGHQVVDKRATVQVSVRFETELFELVKASAIRNRRTIAQEFVYRTITAINAEECK